MILCSCFQTRKPNAHFRIPSSATAASGTSSRPARRKPGTLGTPPGASAHSTGAVFFFSSQLEAPRLTSKMPEDRNARRQAFSEAGHPRSESCRRALHVPVPVALVCRRARCPAKWTDAGPSGTHVTMPYPPGSLCQPVGPQQNRTRNMCCLGGKLWRLALSQRRSHPPGIVLSPRKVGTRRREHGQRKKGKWEEIGHGGCYFYFLLQLRVFL